MAETFKAGDIVQLKSGGPKMTVGGPGPGGKILCQWFAGSKLESGMLSPDSIVRAGTDDKAKPEKTKS